MGEDSRVRIEEQVGPYGDKHAITIDKFREVHHGAFACASCKRKQREQGDK